MKNENNNLKISVPGQTQQILDSRAEKIHLRVSLSEVEEKSVEDGSKRGSTNIPIEMGY